MSNAELEVSFTEDFEHEIICLADAAINTIGVRTREPYRAMEVLHRIAVDDLQMKFKFWTTLDGYEEFATGEGDKPQDLREPESVDKSTAAIEKALLAVLDPDSEDGCFYVLMNPQHAFTSPYIHAVIKKHTRLSVANAKRVIMLIPPEVEIAPEIEDDIHVIDFKTPSYNEFEYILNELFDSLSGDGEDNRPSWDKKDIDNLLKNAAGMTANEFTNAISIAMVTHRDDLYKDTVGVDKFIDSLVEQKMAILKKTDLLELMPKAQMSDVGGLDLMKKWIKKRKKAFTDKASEFGIDKPKGVVTVGIPGTGKSLVSKAISAELDIPCIKLDFGRMFGSLVGESEGRMRRALLTIEAMAPCVLMVDEIDKGLGGVGGGSGGDSGTSSRVFGTFLTWLQDRHNEESPIFTVMTANNIDGMPPELMRRGRVDEIFAVNFPNKSEVVEILKIHLKKRKHEKSLTDDELWEVAGHCTNFVGAEIETVVNDALIEAFSTSKKDKTPKLKVSHLISQTSELIPISKAYADKVKRMNEWAKTNARSASSEMEKSKKLKTKGRTGNIRRRTLKASKHVSTN